MTLVKFTDFQKTTLVLKDFGDFVQEALGTALEAQKAPEGFPELPARLEVTPSLKAALEALPALFARIQPERRRPLDSAEVADLGAELVAIKEILTVLGQREEDIKEYVRNHQDTVAEQEGRAFAKDVTVAGNVVQEATPRDAKGHYLLATPGNPEVTTVPGTTVKLANQYSSGKLKTDLEALTRQYEAGEIDRKTYLAVTEARRVVNAEKLRDHVLKTGRVDLIAAVSSRGLPSSAMYVRGIPRTPKKN